MERESDPGRGRKSVNLASLADGLHCRGKGRGFCSDHRPVLLNGIIDCLRFEFCLSPPENLPKRIENCRGDRERPYEFLDLFHPSGRMGKGIEITALGIAFSMASIVNSFLKIEFSADEIDRRGASAIQDADRRPQNVKTGEWSAKMRLFGIPNRIRISRWMASLALLGAVLTLPMARAASGPDEEPNSSRKAAVDSSDGEAPSYSIHEEQMLELGRTDRSRYENGRSERWKLRKAVSYRGRAKEILQTRNGSRKEINCFGYARAKTRSCHALAVTAHIVAVHLFQRKLRS